MPSVRKIEAPAQREAAKPPAGFPQITFDMIRDWVGEQSFKRSGSYVERSVFDTRRTGMTLKARCQGTDSRPYDVRVTLDEDGISSDDCSCPVGSHCKHVAAVLQTWRNEPQVFIEVESLDAVLGERDKAELIQIIHRMIDRYPDLEMMLELPTVIVGKGGKPLDDTMIRQQIANIFRSVGMDEWGVIADVAVRLEPFVQIGRDYGSAGDWRSAMNVYRAVIAGVTEHYGELHDESGDLHEVVSECIIGLGEAIDESQDEPSLRAEALRALFDVYRWDIEYGGIDMGAEAPDIILHHITTDERRMLIAWTEEAIAKRGSDEWSGKWRKQALGRFLLELRGPQLSDDEFIAIAKQTGRLRDVVERLLQINRVDEAVAELRQAEPADVLELADMIRAAGEGVLAEDAVRKRQDGSRWQESYDRWLRERALERGDTGVALALSEKLFWRRPDLRGYDELKKHAQGHGTWETVWPQLLRRLERDKQHALLTEALLREGDVERALKSVRLVTTPFVAGDQPLIMRVAQAAEKDFPREALALYEPFIEQLIDWRGRDNYRATAHYLTGVREIYRRLNDVPAWDALIAQIRQKNKMLHSLKEELDKAGL